MQVSYHQAGNSAWNFQEFLAHSVGLAYPQIEAKQKQAPNRCRPHVNPVPENPSKLQQSTNSKPVNYKALVIFWRKVVIRSDIFL